ncbi:hypothetical protein CCP2SC5_2200002 [Azospirillaceae bacterium]
MARSPFRRLMITVGRTVCFSLARLEFIAEVKRATRLPVIANGDI